MRFETTSKVPCSSLLHEMTLDNITVDFPLVISRMESRLKRSLSAQTTVMLKTENSP